MEGAPHCHRHAGESSLLSADQKAREDLGFMNQTEYTRHRHWGESYGDLSIAMGRKNVSPLCVSVSMVGDSKVSEV